MGSTTVRIGTTQFRQSAGTEDWRTLGEGACTHFRTGSFEAGARNRIHVDVWVADDQAEVRVAATVAAGGRLLSDERAPSFWVLADSEGSEACVCTTM